MSRWDALQPSSRQFSGNRQHRPRSRGGNECDCPNRVLSQKKTGSASWRGRKDRPNDVSGDIQNELLASRRQDQIENEWKQKLKNFCEYSHEKESSYLDRNENEAASGDGSTEQKLRLKELSELAISSKTSLSPQAVGEGVVTLVDCSQRLPRDVNAEVLRFVARLATDFHTVLTMHGARHCVDVLSSFPQEFLENPLTHQKDMDIDLARLESLVGLVSSTVRLLPAEDTARRLVQGIFIPLIASYDENHHNNELRVNWKVVKLSIDGIRSLLKDQKHASAVLAPLVLDVARDGGESRMPNTIRVLLLQAIQSLLKTEEINRHSFILQYACSALAFVIDSIRRLEQTSGSSKELDILTVERFLHKAVLPRSPDNKEMVALQVEALNLVVSMLKAFPNSSSSLSSLLLSQRSFHSTEFHCSVASGCRCHLSSPLQYLLHSTTFNQKEPLVASINATQELLRTMPLKLWLSGRNGAHYQHHLSHRVSQDLERLIRVTNCRFMRLTRSSPFATAAFSHLFATILTNAIFCQDDLTNAAVGLLCTVGTKFVQALSCKPENAALETLGNSLVECMGGRLTPLGIRTSMPHPVQQWLLTTRSQPFRDGLYEGATSSDAMAGSMCIKIFSAAVRTQPWVVQHDSESFRKLLFLQVRSTQQERIRLDSLKLLENFLLGRQEFGGEDQLDTSTDWVVSFVLRVLPGMTNEPSSSIRTAAMNVYGALSEVDWCLLFDESDVGKAHVRSVLSHCVVDSSSSARSAGECSGRVRSVACKAIGNACTQILAHASNKRPRCTGDAASLSEKEARWVCGEVLDAMAVSINDSDPSVRSMALFAIGNIAHAARTMSFDGVLVSAFALEKLSPLIHHSLCDKNEKVVGNAIRTSGHFYFLFFRNYVINDSKLASATDKNIVSYEKILSVLSDKVELAVTEATGDPTFLKRTWKERSAIRKHAWGSCNSLLVLLECGNVSIGEDGIEYARKVIQTMLKCVENIDSMNEKVAVAAVSALVSISVPTWSHVSSGTGIGGMALRTCLTKVYKANSTETLRGSGARLHRDLEMLLEKLLTVATISDVCTMLKHDDISKHMLEYLYEWMTERENSIEARAFESFALALQRRDLGGGEVSLQQKFASRALQRYRSQQEPPSLRTETENICILDETIKNDRNSDGYDEL